MSPRKFFSFVLILVVLFFLYYTIITLHQPYPIPNKTIVIEKGTSALRVAKELQHKKIIPSASLFLVVEKLLPSSKQLRYGKFNFSGWFSFMDVVKKLTSGEVVTNRITIPEGFTVRRIASMLFKKELADYSKFMSLCSDSSFIDSLGLDVSNLEGFLFPDTYYIPYYADESFVITMMIENFFMQWDVLQPQPLGFDSLYNIVILASIVEREAIYDDERPLIAGVYTKRLKEKMLLQADPTVAYALELKRISRNKIYYDDLKIKSVYNTYLYRGLPPTPICNPGKQSLLAALHPQETDYLFFFAGKNKRHIFSKSYHEHLKKLNRI